MIDRLWKKIVRKILLVYENAFCGTFKVNKGYYSSHNNTLLIKKTSMHLLSKAHNGWELYQPTALWDFVCQLSVAEKGTGQGLNF